MADTIDLCERCVAANTAHPLQRVCAFPDPRYPFNHGNWNCGSINVLWERADEMHNCANGPDKVFYGADESLAVLSVTDHEWGGTEGWVILARYKRRGRTTSAIWVGDWETPRPVTLQLVERILRSVT